MRKKSLYLFAFLTLFVALFVAFNKSLAPSTVSNTKPLNFAVKKVDFDKDLNKKTKDAINLLSKNNGVFLLNSDEDNISYLILNGRHISINDDAPFYSGITVEAKDNAILINYSESSKLYSSGKYQSQELIYKITVDKKYDYIKVFKNGEESHFDGIGA